MFLDNGECIELFSIFLYQSKDNLLNVNYFPRNFNNDPIADPIALPIIQEMRIIRFLSQMSLARTK
jgi:hypothetical protein